MGHDNSMEKGLLWSLRDPGTAAARQKTETIDHALVQYVEGRYQRAVSLGNNSSYREGERER